MSSHSPRGPGNRSPLWAILALALRERGIIVRHFGKPERIQDYLRITIGRPEQNRELVQALGDILS